MEVRVKSIRISIIVGLLMLGAIFVVEYCLCGHIKNILFAIATGLFASSMITLIFNVSEYFLLRKKTLEKYWENASIINAAISNIQVLYLANEENVLAKIKKVWSDVEKNERLAYGYHIDRRDENVYFDDLELQQCKDMIIRVMNSYLSVSEFSFRTLEKIYGDIYFFAGNKKRTEIYNNIHDPLRKTLNMIKEKCGTCFLPYIQSEHNNLLAVIKQIEDLQNEIFHTCVKEESNYRKVFFYNEKYDEMSRMLETFRAKSVYHVNPEYEKKYWRYCASTVNEQEKINR